MKAGLGSSLLGMLGGPKKALGMLFNYLPQIEPDIAKFIERNAAELPAGKFACLSVSTIQMEDGTQRVVIYESVAEVIEGGDMKLCPIPGAKYTLTQFAQMVAQGPPKNETAENAD